MTPLPTLPVPAAGPGLARRLPLLALLVLTVLMVHAWLLAGLPTGLVRDAGDARRPMTVRQIVRPAAPAPEAAPAQTPTRPPVVPRPTRPKVATAPAAAQPVTPATDPEPPAPAPTVLAQAPAAEEPPVDEPREAEAAPAAASAPAEPTPEPAPAGPPGDAPPVYATRVPPAAVLRYELRRGLLTGQGLLSWRPGPERYELEIEGTAFGVPVLGWASNGGFDAAGLAPLRFVDRRRGRDVRAANFQRDKGVITWSSVAGELPLPAGAQDRLSWMLQLAAIIEAQPGRFVSGTRVVMLVTGARGDADLWAFGVSGVEGVDVVGQRVEGTLALRREPRKPYDTQVEVWLDPARHHLPVRLKLSTAGGGESLEFLLKP